MFEPTLEPASSSSTVRPRSRRYRMTESATARSSPGGLGSAASSVKRSTTSEGIELASHLQHTAGLSRPRRSGEHAREIGVTARATEERDRIQTRPDLGDAEVDRPDAVGVDTHRTEPHSPRDVAETGQVDRHAVELLP